MEAEINKTEERKTMEKIKETNIWFFEKIKNINKCLLRLTKRERERKKIQIPSIRNEMGYHYRPHRHQKGNKGVF